MKKLLVLGLMFAVQTQAQTNKEALQAKVVATAGKYQLISFATTDAENHPDCAQVLEFKPVIKNGELAASTMDLDDCADPGIDSHFKGYLSNTLKTTYKINRRGEITIKNACREVMSGGDGYSSSKLSYVRAVETIEISKDLRTLDVTVKARFLGIGNADCTHQSNFESDRVKTKCHYARIGE